MRFTRRRMLRVGCTALAGGLLSACELFTDDDSDSTADTTPTGPETESTPAATPSATQPAPTATEPTSTPTQSPEPTATPDPDRERVIFRAVRFVNIISPVPYLSFPGRDGIATRLCLEPLFEYDANLEPVLVLARTWPTVENGLLDPDLRWVVWELRDDVRWHDGEPFTADDLRFTWQWVLESNSWDPSTRRPFRPIEDIEILDDYTARVLFTRSNPEWINLFRGAGGVILPEHVFADVDPSPRTPWTQAETMEPIGTGVWGVEDFDSIDSEYVYFERSAEHTRSVSSNIDRVEINTGGGVIWTARQVLENGEADWAEYLVNADPDELAALDRKTGELATFPSGAVERLVFNFVDPASTDDPVHNVPSEPHPILSDRRIREAIALAIPRECIAEVVHGITHEPAFHSLPLHRHLDSQPFPEQDLERARALVSEAGHDGALFRVKAGKHSIREKRVELIAEALEGIGFQVEVRFIDAGVFYSLDLQHPDSIARFDADILIYPHGPGNNPYPLEWASRYRTDQQMPRENAILNDYNVNFARYKNSDFDRVHEQLQVEVDPDEQSRLWSDLLGILRNDLVEVPLVHRLDVVAIGNRVKNWSLNPWAENPSWDLHNWKIDGLL